jgi:ankyrin repeat protein
MRSAILVFALVSAVACRHTPEIDELPLAVRAGDVNRTLALLARGANPNRPSGANDWPPLMHAVHKNQLGTAEALLTHGADADRGAFDGMTPLMMAAGYGNDKMVEILLEHRADPHLRTRAGSSALDFAFTGVTDIDDFTLLDCQRSTAQLLLRKHVTARPASMAWGRVKCMAYSIRSTILPK